MLTFTALFGQTGLILGVILPLTVAQLLTLALVPSLLVLRSSQDARGVLTAVYCYCCMGLGVALMTLSGIPAGYAVLSGKIFTSVTYFALLIVFTLGGVLFLWHEQYAHRIAPAIRAIPQAVFFFTIKILGLLVSIFAGLSILLTLLLAAAPLAGAWWAMPAVFLVYGLFLCFCTRLGKPPSAFSMTSMIAGASAATPKKKK
jgi:hypothetical protein